MRTRRSATFACAVLLLILLAGCANAGVSPDSLNTPPGDEALAGRLVVSVIDVGQGDSILIQTPQGKTMLIDAGDAFAQGVVEAYLRRQRVETIDILIATHPKQSHIGGMAHIVERFDIGVLYIPDTALTNAEQALSALKAAVRKKGTAVVAARAGAPITLDDTLCVDMIAPMGDGYPTNNDFSAVVKLTYGDTSFLFTGDATEISENEMLRAGIDMRADVLKVGHHGEATSSGEAFLRAVAPAYAVISVGEGNWYGHPEQAVLERLYGIGAAVYRTDLHGTVMFVSDGERIRVYAQ